MSLKLREGDYVPDGAGGFQRAYGLEAILEQAMFQLTARRGAFSLMPEVGSRLYTLYREKPSVRKTLAIRYAGEALEPLGLTVKDAVVTSGEPMLVELELGYEGNEMNLEVTVN